MEPTPNVSTSSEATRIFENACKRFDQHIIQRDQLDYDFARVANELSSIANASVHAFNTAYAAGGGKTTDLLTIQDNSAYCQDELLLVQCQLEKIQDIEREKDAQLFELEKEHRAIGNESSEMRRKFLVAEFMPHMKDAQRNEMQLREIEDQIITSTEGIERLAVQLRTDEKHLRQLEETLAGLTTEDASLDYELQQKKLTLEEFQLKWKRVIEQESSKSHHVDPTATSDAIESRIPAVHEQITVITKQIEQLQKQIDKDLAEGKDGYETKQERENALQKRLEATLGSTMGVTTTTSTASSPLASPREIMSRLENDMQVTMKLLKANIFNVCDDFDEIAETVFQTLQEKRNDNSFSYRQNKFLQTIMEVVSAIEDDHGHQDFSTNPSTAQAMLKKVKRMVIVYDLFEESMELTPADVFERAAMNGDVSSIYAAALAAKSTLDEAKRQLALKRKQSGSGKFSRTPSQPDLK